MSDKLEKFNSNIIKWYPFKEKDEILQIGNNENITRTLKEKVKSIKVLEETEVEKISDKYDYILLYGYEKLPKLISKIGQGLKKEGKILITGNNETGINNWSKYRIEQDTQLLKIENHNKELKTIETIKKEAQKNGLNGMNIYYVFPNYEIPDVIINKEFKIEKSHIEKYNTELIENDIQIFDEKNVLKTIIKNNPNMLEFFANSYFIEISKEKIYNDMKYISFNNCRKEQYQLITIVKDNIVEKKPANNNAIGHIKNMIEIINTFKEQNIENLDYEKEQKIYSKLIANEKTLDEILSEKSDDTSYIVEIFNILKDLLLKNSKKYEECKEKIEIQEKEEILSKLHFLENCYWDMVPKNCFYIDNRFIFFDQEWKEKYLPLEFLIYRAVINCYDLARKINVDDLLTKLEIYEYKNLFSKIDEELREKIIDKEIYKLLYKKENVKKIDNFINENKDYKEELERKEKYIKDLNNYQESLQKDNLEKQKYIEKLENEIKGLQEDNSKKQEYITNLEEMQSQIQMKKKRFGNSCKRK